MANIHTITLGTNTIPVITQLRVYKCPSCNRDIVSYTYTPSTNNWSMNVIGNATVFD